MKLPKKLVSKRLFLRPINQDDFNVFSDILKDNGAIKELEFIQRMKLDADIGKLFNFVISSYISDNPIITLMVFNKVSGDLIGLCGLVPSKDGILAQCFYIVVYKYRGYGFAIESIKKLMEYAFEESNLVRITTYINPSNSQAWKVAERVGMKYLGDVQIQDTSLKAMYYSIEKSEFKAQRDY